MTIDYYILLTIIIFNFHHYFKQHRFLVLEIVLMVEIVFSAQQFLF